MSRMGNQPLEIPEKVNLSQDGQVVTAKGPKGELSETLPEGIKLKINDDQVKVDRRDDTKLQKSYHGLAVSLIRNIIIGVSEGFIKTLQLSGLGYRVRKQGSDLVLELGFSNPVEIDVPEGIEVDVPNNTTIKVSGINKQQVGNFSATLRYLRDPDPYNQKGIKYEGEYIRKKVGKAVGGEGGDM